MSIVVVEGPDGAGKSTLIDNLRLVTDRHYVSLRRSGPPKHISEITTIVNWINQQANGLVPLICDRHPLISEPIYGEILRGSNLLDGMYTVDDIRSLVILIDRVIYCRPPTSVIEKKMHDNPQLKGVISKIDAITRQYDWTMQLLRHWGVRVINYDWTGAKLTQEFAGRTCDLNKLFFGE